MRPETYQMLSDREDTYWWHVARRAMSAELLSHCGIPSRSRWLDLGCGPGGNLNLSKPFVPSLTVGIDISPLALSIARTKKPDARLIQADLNNMLPFQEAAFDVVTVFNVLYHDWITDEQSTIAEIARVLRPGGVLLITEPAFSVLARELDAAAMGNRRYRLADVFRWCNAARLRPSRGSYFTSFGFPLILAMKTMKALHNTSRDDAGTQALDMKPINPRLNRILRLIARYEARAIAWGMRVPLGTTLVCVAKKGL
jgi:SAM-dependent methyltransferase